MYRYNHLLFAAKQTIRLNSKEDPRTKCVDFFKTVDRFVNHEASNVTSIDERHNK